MAYDETKIGAMIDLVRHHNFPETAARATGLPLDVLRDPDVSRRIAAAEKESKDELLAVVEKAAEGGDTKAKSWLRKHPGQKA